MREKVLLICEECLSRNYQTTINRENNKQLVIKKFCPKCGKHTLHKISK
ncbi:MAG: 50S ribosomal protein L33 [Bacilli bacterium]|nr:50S ribosomal protein L33 [Bacilli bacterium]